MSKYQMCPKCNSKNSREYSEQIAIEKRVDMTDVNYTKRVQLRCKSCGHWRAVVYDLTKPEFEAILESMV